LITWLYIDRHMCDNQIAHRNMCENEIRILSIIVGNEEGI